MIGDNLLPSVRYNRYRLAYWRINNTTSSKTTTTATTSAIMFFYFSFCFTFSLIYIIAKT
jgi:hypothetical protein